MSTPACRPHCPKEAHVSVVRGVDIAPRFPIHPEDTRSLWNADSPRRVCRLIFAIKYVPISPDGRSS